MRTAPIGILGASGYSGMEATRILALHPGAELRVLASDRWAGELVEKRLGAVGPGAAKLRYAPMERAEELARECAAVLLCTPAEASLELAPRLLHAGVKVIDLSGAFRLKDQGSFRAAYGLAHLEPALLAEAVYALPELETAGATPGSHRSAIGRARLISNPGCYPTSAALALAPLLAAGLLADEALVIDAASGTTGAGRKASEELSFSEVAGDFHAYRTLRHQHTPEIAQTLSLAAAREVRLTFTPHLLPLRRGILATCYARLAPGVDGGALLEALVHKYAAEPFIALAGSADEVGLRHVVGTNRCQIGLSFSPGPGGYDPGRVVVISAIDNLVKGAAGQAIQNLNLCMGWEETTGLLSLRGVHP